MTSLNCPGGGNTDCWLLCYSLAEEKHLASLGLWQQTGDAILASVFLRGQRDTIGQTRILFGVLCAESRVTLSGSGLVPQQGDSHNPGEKQ